MILLFRIYVQLNVELLRSETPSTLEQLPVYSYFITARNQLDCFDKIENSLFQVCTIQKKRG